MGLKIATVSEVLDILASPLRDRTGLTGVIVWQLFDEDGNVKECGANHNLVTRVGDQYYGERAAGISSPPGQVTGMKLGTGTTAVAKTGAGAAIVTYTTGSNATISGGFPTSALSGSSRLIEWQSVWAAGTATANSIAEVVITNQASNTDTIGSAADTISRALLSPVVNKGASDSLSITWDHLLLGA